MLLGHIANKGHHCQSQIKLAVRIFLELDIFEFVMYCIVTTLILYVEARDCYHLSWHQSSHLQPAYL